MQNAILDFGTQEYPLIVKMEYGWAVFKELTFTAGAGLKVQEY